MRVFLTLTILTALYAVGVLLFTSGFLLRRIVISSNSTCKATPDQKNQNDLQLSNDCATKAHFKKAVIIVIDALRYDFVHYNYSDGFVALPFQNKFRKVASLLKDKPDNSRLYRFVADPPTTTLQRLKGLTTGSLPTFVDAGSNFGKTEISEDNFIDQLRSFNRSIVFMGDDTWIGLYPDRFSKSFPYPSFNVKDLHTVDNGVIKHLTSELISSDWDLLIGHMLGVDHCGHTFGPNHPAMMEKLEEMDDLVDSVIKSLDNETILFVFGDHGMTKHGDHGGGSIEEVEAALFVYSPKNLSFSGEISKDDSIAQVDFVASISLLLGLPIPYQNLGVVVSDLFRFCDDCDGKGDDIKKELNLLKALHLNALQVHDYISSYIKVSQGHDNFDFESLNSLLDEAESEFGRISNLSDAGDIGLERLIRLQSDFRLYILSVRSTLHKKWAQFDMPSMFFGIVIFFAALFINLSLIFTEDLLFSCKSLLVVFGCFVVSFCLICCRFYILSLSSFLFGVAILTFFAVWEIFYKKVSVLSFVGADFADISLLFVWLIYVVSMFSNSFVVHEGAVTSFLLQTSFYIQFLSSVWDHSRYFSPGGNKNLQKFPHDSKLKNRNSILLLIIFAFVANLSFSLSKTFHTCREELTNCKESWLLQFLLRGDEAASDKKNILLLSSIAVLSIFFLVYQWLKRNGNMNGRSLSVVACKYVVFVAYLSVITYWCMRMATTKYPLLSYLSLCVAKSSYLFVFLSLLMVISQPLCTFIWRYSPPSIRNSFQSSIFNDILLTADTSGEIVPRIFHRLRTNWSSDLVRPAEDEPKLYVYGLSTVFSSPLLVFLLSITILLIMLLDVSLSPSVFLLYVALFCILEFHSIRIRLNSRKMINDIPTCSIILMLLLLCERFYSFGHHPDITSIRWEAAYHGFKGDFESNLLPAILIGLNMFSSQIIVTLALPLLVYWPVTRGLSINKQDLSRKVDSLHPNGDSGVDDESNIIKGEFVICEEANVSPMSRLCLKTIFLVALKLFGLMVCVTIHRRHLMVWKIFAPRFIYETVSFFVVSVICIFNYLFFLRTNRAVDQFVSNLK